jgi:polyhydroxyalkanoate synthesis regulator protein
VLNDLVRSYSTQASTVVPDFLSMSFEMLKQGQSKMMENMTAINPIAKMPGFEAMRAQQEAFIKAMTGGLGAQWSAPTDEDGAAPAKGDELDEIKRQLAELQSKLSRM